MEKIIIWFVFLISISVAFCTILEVPDEYNSIQEAVNSSVNGDTVLVSNGEYFENIDFSGRNITVASDYLLSDNPLDIVNTIINGNSVDTVVKFTNNEGTAAKLIGFTIVNGSGVMGGGIFCSNSSPTISYNIVRDNSANFGGGIMANNSTPILQNNTIVQNTGYGIRLANSTIEGTGCIFFYNEPEEFNIASGSLYLTFSDIEDGFDGEGNISEVPLFTDPESSNYSLQIGSICINAGNPFIDPDLDGTRSDMGALYTSNDESSLYADFNASGLMGEIPFSIDFTNNSQTFNTEITEILWQFGENDFSSLENPTFTFVEPGIYDISLTIEDDLGNISLMFKENFITATATEYNGPIWYVSTEGSDLIGNGSVNYPFETIQYAINTVNDDDIIIIEPGSYQEILAISSKNIILASRYYLTNDESYIGNTIIDANYNGSGISFYGVIDSTCIITGFSIINGFSLAGGGVYCENASPKLTNLSITNCEVNNGGPYSRGGGIYCNVSELIIEHSIISNNICQNATYLQGGGLYANSSDITIRNSEFSSNSSEYGSGIYLQDSESLIINTMIRDNDADNNAAGLGINEGYAELINCVIVNNVAMGFGGGICGWNYADITITNCTFAENTGVLNGGAFFLYNGVTGIINNTIFWDNVPEQIFYDPSNLPNQVEVNYSCFEDGVDGIVANGNGVVTWLEGNIENDPVFLDSGEYPYQLLNGSPCIDTGTPDPIYLNLPAIDILGNHRIWDGDGDEVASVDMGAYEFSAPPYQSLLIEPHVLEFYTYEDCTDGLTFTITNPNSYDISIDSITQNGMFNAGLAVWSISNLTIEFPYIILPEEELEFIVEIGLPVEEVRDILIDHIYIDTSYEQQSVTLLLDGDLITSSEEDIISNKTQLIGNFPNPFNPETVISYQLAKESHVELEIYNVKGQCIRSLVEEEKQVGSYEVTWKGMDANDREVSSGIYFYLMKTGEYSEIKKMMLLK